MATARDRRILRRRIIERPRLYALLDESPAQVRMLVAPAGYGKTTLAEQWTGRDGRTGAWYRARRASVDVAALALGLARAAATVVPGCDELLREHLRAVPNAAEHADVLAELLGEGLVGWPSEAWLVLDDYQELAREARAEGLVASLVAAAPVRLLVASRQRPSWVTMRDLLYGEVLELNQTALAMDSTEAAELLAGRSGRSASGLVALANGWPAVIGLASVSADEPEDDRDDDLSGSLYGFFAEEVFAALGEEVRSGLATLALVPVLDAELAAALLGPERADAVCTAALEVGILVERGAHLELHPLARAFLGEDADSRLALPLSELVRRCLAHYRERRDWDAAFELVARNESLAELEPLLLAALDELLDTARLSTLRTWCGLAADSGVESPAFALARAEIALRSGRYAEARTLGVSVAESERTELAFRALSVAGRAAHLASREEEALALYRRAEGTAATDDERRDARWGQLRCKIELMLPEAHGDLPELRKGVSVANPREVVQAAAEHVNYQLRFPPLDLADADRAAELLPVARDPLVQSAFLSIYANALALQGRYGEALTSAARLRAVAGRYRLDFAVPYALCCAAMAYAGLRRWERCDRRVGEALRAARATRDAHVQQFGFAVRVRSLTQRGRCREALALEPPPLERALPVAKAEVVGSLALALAAAGRLEEALLRLEELGEGRTAAEPAVLAAATEAIVCLKRREEDAGERAAELVDTVLRTGVSDPLVAAYRSVPELLALLLRLPSHREHVERLLRGAGDEDLAEALGHPIGPGDDPRSRLSPREREVFELLSQGLSNRQIAKALFISEATVKVHAHHIYDKLGVRSRVALTIQAALERARQATSATGSPDSAPS
jgi:LuxR family maltose regulon positive regulatory protein